MTGVEDLCERIAGRCKRIDDEIEQRDYSAVRASAKALTDAVHDLNGVLDLMIDGNERERLVAVHGSAAEHWIKALKVLRAYDAEMAKEQSVVEVKAMPPEDPAVELERLRAERREDVAAVAAVLHWVKQV